MTPSVRRPPGVGGRTSPKATARERSAAWQEQRNEGLAKVAEAMQRETGGSVAMLVDFHSHRTGFLEIWDGEGGDATPYFKEFQRRRPELKFHRLTAPGAAHMWAKEEEGLNAHYSFIAEMGFVAGWKAEDYHDVGRDHALTMHEVLHYKDAAHEVAGIVFENSERQDLLEKGAGINRADPPRDLEEFKAEDELDRMVVCFVPVGPVDDWLVREAGEKLEKVLGIDVYLYPESLPLPDPHRSLYQRWIENLRSDIDWDHPMVAWQMSLLGIESPDDADDEDIITLLSRLQDGRANGNPEAGLREQQEWMKGRDEQWDASRLLAQLEKMVPRKDNLLVEPVLQLRPGRPRLPDAHRRRGNADRQRRYRARVREKLDRLKRLEAEYVAIAS